MILIVEHSHEFRVCWRDALENEGFQVLTATTGDAALLLLESLSPAAIVLDLDLPLKDGVEVLATVRARALTDAPILIVAAEDPRSRRVVGTWLKKPFGVDALMGSLRELLRPT